MTKKFRIGVLSDAESPAEHVETAARDFGLEPITTELAKTQPPGWVLCLQATEESGYEGSVKRACYFCETQVWVAASSVAISGPKTRFCCLQCAAAGKIEKHRES